MTTETLEKPPTPSAMRAFLALAGFSFFRLWRVRQMGWVAIGLLAILTTIVGVMTHGTIRWGLGDRYSPRFKMRFRDYPVQLDLQQLTPMPPEAIAIQMAVYAPVRAVLADEKFLRDYAFLNFSRWVVFAMYLTFLLPLFTLAYASAAIGAEREGRTLIWLVSRPLPRWAVYLAKFLGVLPWCFVASAGGFAVLCLAGGDLGQRAAATYWPAVLAGTLSFSALFHLIGSVFRRPAVVGLVYIFFFETLVANLPGSLKQLSLNFYVKSLLYNEAKSAVASAVPEQLEVYAPTDPTSAWVVLLLATVGLTLLGMALFSRQEPQDEV